MSQPRLCHCGKPVSEKCTSGDVDRVFSEHETRCCDCFDAIVAGEPKFCAECAEAEE